MKQIVKKLIVRPQIPIVVLLKKNRANVLKNNCLVPDYVYGSHIYRGPNALECTFYGNQTSV